MSRISAFLLGAVTFGCLLAMLFFIRFRHITGERLFAYFALAFGLLGIHWSLVAFTTSTDEHRPLLYLIRLSAFVVVLIAIADKNRRER
jgi:membrane protein CcdC involved in cytochrome C biogenesis